MGDKFTHNSAVLLVSTVAENMKIFSKRQIEQANIARKLYGMVGRPSMKDFKTLVRGNMLRNFPVTVEDVDIGNRVYSIDVASLKGKMIATQSKAVNVDIIHVPPDLMLLHKEVELTGDAMFVNGLPFFVTISRHLTFGTVKAMKDRTTQTLISSLKEVINV